MRCITSAHNKTHNHTKNTEFDISKKSTISKQIQQYPIIIIIIIFNVLRIVGKFWTGVPAQFSQKNWSIQNLGQEDKRANRKQLKAISGKIKVSQNFSLFLIYSIYVWLLRIKLYDFFPQRHSEVTSRYLSSSAHNDIGFMPYIASYSIGLGLLNTCSMSFYRFEVMRRYLSSSAHSNIGFKYYLLWPGLIYSSFSIQCPFYILLIGALHIDRLYWFQINTYLSDNAGPHKL